LQHSLPTSFALEQRLSTPDVAAEGQPRLNLDERTFRVLLEQLGPSLALWRGAEVAVLRRCRFDRPILDLGCGDGFVASLVLPRVEAGVDPYRPALEAARRQGTYDLLKAVHVEESGLPAESFATVLSNSVLEHLPRLDAVLRAAARLLRPGGRLIFTVPTEAFTDWLALPLARYGAWRNRRLGHLNLWPIEGWAKRLSAVGLEVKEVRPYLRRGLVWAWDACDLLEQVWIGRLRLLAALWRGLSADALDRLAQRAAGLDLSALAPGGGRLVVAVKR
jgi:SAM-dependent methyltransferase